MINKKYLQFVLIITVFISCFYSCECSQSSRTYQDIDVNKIYFPEFGHADTFKLSDGSLTVITYGELDCNWSNYSDPGDECKFIRFESCQQFGNVILGEEALTNELKRSYSSDFIIYIDSLILKPYIANNSNNQGIYVTHPDTMTLLGVHYEDVYKYERTNSPQSAIRWVVFNRENRIIQVRMNNGIVWNRKP